MNDLKNALSRAFKEAAPESYGGFWQAVVYDDTSNDHYDLNGLVNADKLAQAITDYFLDREKVRAALAYALTTPDDYDEDDTFTPLLSWNPNTKSVVIEDGLIIIGDPDHRHDIYRVEFDLIRLIEGLAGKVGE